MLDRKVEFDERLSENARTGKARIEVVISAAAVRSLQCFLHRSGHRVFLFSLRNTEGGGANGICNF